MEKILKTGCVLMVVLFVAITVGSVTEQDVYAGGGVNWKVKVSNPTEYSVEAWVWTRQFDVSKEHHDAKVTIAPGGSHTFETGASCPSAIEGNIYVGGSLKKMKEIDCLGGDHAPGTAVMSTCCWNISVKVCQKAGQGYTEVRDLDYGFCKE